MTSDATGKASAMAWLMEMLVAKRKRNRFSRSCQPMPPSVREAVLADPSARVRELALLYFPEIEKMHADMRRLKQAAEG